ncbi:LytR/AlgR family response regulator transcription factor [Sphingobacterium mizutaii]|uniref:LytR/AlgR family response regulator transcription factor n=1 Tax=Sphingobacterium mizutaii TaxID=1010 RepID=UPI00162AD90B|nr:LytTR family DNA-binding domain-containing protein [Sphingobacterium mizutaii]
MIKCIVIDDEELAQEMLVSKLNKIPDVEILGVYDNAMDAMKILKKGDVNLVFCDIQMPDMDGVTFLKSFRNPPLFVFVTGDPTYAVESFELNVVDYVLKPFGPDRLLKAIEKALIFLDSEKENSKTSKHLIIKDRSIIIITPYDELYYIKADKDYVWVETKEKTYNLWKKLIDMEGALASAKQFVRVHKSFIVNLDFAKRVEGNVIKMRGNIEDIPIGGQYKSELYKRLGLAE